MANNAQMFSMQKNNFVVLDVTEPTIEGIAFVLPNESSKKPLGRFAVIIDYVEEITVKWSAIWRVEWRWRSMWRYLMVRYSCSTRILNMRPVIDGRSIVGHKK